MIERISGIMYIKSIKLIFYIPFATSLKDKRKIRLSLVDKTSYKFNVSIAEVDNHDMHQTLTVGVAIVSGDSNHAQTSIEKIIRFMDEHTEAELIEVLEL